MIFSYNKDLKQDQKLQKAEDKHNSMKKNDHVGRSDDDSLVKKGRDTRPTGKKMDDPRLRCRDCIER